MPRLKRTKTSSAPPAPPQPGDNELSTLLNVGPQSAAWLFAAGIHTRQQIKELGVIEVCRRVRSAGYPVAVSLAYALEGALAGCPWNALPQKARHSLRLQFDEMKLERP
jgi:hypothetical protein